MSKYADFKLRSTVSVAVIPSLENIKFTDISARNYETETEIFVIVIEGKYLATLNLSPVPEKKRESYK
jgi:hypothetical protein